MQAINILVQYLQTVDLEQLDLITEPTRSEIHVATDTLISDDIILFVYIANYITTWQREIMNFYYQCARVS